MEIEPEWFATRGNFPGPTLYVGKLLPSDIYCYYNGRGEQEFIARTRPIERIELSRSVVSAIEAEIETGDGPLGSVTLSVNAEGKLTASWKDSSLRFHSVYFE